MVDREHSPIIDMEQRRRRLLIEPTKKVVQSGILLVSSGVFNGTSRRIACYAGDSVLGITDTNVQFNGKSFTSAGDFSKGLVIQEIVCNGGIPDRFGLQIELPRAIELVTHSSLSELGSISPQQMRTLAEILAVADSTSYDVYKILAHELETIRPQDI